MKPTRMSVFHLILLLLPLAALACDDPLPTAMEVLEVETGGYHLHLEPMPEHIHTEDVITLAVEVHDESGATAQPVTGLTPEFHVTEADGTETTQEGADVTEPEAGVYQITHSFAVGGDAVIHFHFTGSGGTAAAAEFVVEVVEAHD